MNAIASLSAGSAADVAALDAIDRRLLNEFQRDLPLGERPFAVIGARLGCSETEVIERLETLQQRGFVSRVGAVVAPRRVGDSVLAAMRVPEARLREVADLVNGYCEVNHNYAREHEFNLWFVVVAADGERVQTVLDDIERRTGIAVMALPLERAYHIDLGFRLW